MIFTKVTLAAIVSILVNIGLSAIYFFKEKVKNEEIKIYKWLLIANITYSSRYSYISF